MNAKVIPIVQNEGNTMIQLAEAFFSEDAEQRKLARTSMNLAGKALTDELMRYSRQGMHLSSFSDVPSSTGQNTPGAIVFDDATREQVDLKWIKLFLAQDNRGKPNDTFIIEDVYNAVQFEELLVGESVTVRHIEAARNRFEYRALGGGFQFGNFWEEDYPYWDLAEGLRAMPMRYGKQLAKLAIATLIASGSLSVAYDTGGANELEKDINTINEGMTDILSAIYGANRPDGEDVEEEITNPVFYLLYNEFGAGNRNRVNRAINASYTTPNSNMGGYALNHTVIPYPTPEVTGADWELVLAGRKNRLVFKNDLRVYEHFNPFVMGGSTSEIGHGRFGCVRADANQVAQLATS